MWVSPGSHRSKLEETMPILKRKIAGLLLGALLSMLTACSQDRDASGPVAPTTELHQLDTLIVGDCLIELEIVKGDPFTKQIWPSQCGESATYLVTDVIDQISVGVRSCPVGDHVIERNTRLRVGGGVTVGGTPAGLICVKPWTANSVPLPSASTSTSPPLV
jgi:hypothetical protein